MDRLETQADRVKWARVEAGFRSARSAALALGINENTYRAYETGLRASRRGIPRDSLEKIARRFGVSQLWLLSGAGDPKRGVRTAEGAAQPIEGQDIPLLGAALGATAGGFRVDATPRRYVWRTPALAGEFDVYALYVDGDSMAPALPRGALIFVAPSRPCRNGDTVVVTQRAHDTAPAETYVKILAGQDGAKLRLRQINPEATIDMARHTVESVHRVLSLAEIFGV